ncbi:MAG: transposase [Thermodesulfobacteriota bacterium]|nr:transposase [Thermodesulfobacteriota bacterium]
MQYRRARTKNGTYFFTLVTMNRHRILTQPEHATLLRNVFKRVMTRHPFTIEAFVLLPDHIHCIWSLPEADGDYSKRWRLIKSGFSRQCNVAHKHAANESRKTKKELAVWQRRFWEHAIRDDDDFKNHVEYIHYNPVKHGWANTPGQWEYSSFHRYVRNGIYKHDWCAGHAPALDDTIGKE